MEKCLIIIMDGGDVQVTVVDKIEHDWVMSDAPTNARSSWKETIPGTKRRVDCSIGSWENDRALGLLGYATDTFGSIGEAITACKSRGDEIVDGYVGMSY